MRQLTTQIKETETTCGRFWIFRNPNTHQFVLSIRKNLPMPTPVKKGDPQPWRWDTVGRYDRLEDAKNKADQHLECGQPSVEWF